MTHINQERSLWLMAHVLPHEPALRSWLQRKRMGDLEVDDVIQETYTILAERESVEEILNPKAYTFQTAYSVIINHLRRSRIVSIRTAADVEDLGVMIDEPSLERQIADRDELRHVVDAIAALPEKCREVFILWRIECLSQRDIAARLGISENTVEKHVSKGIRLLMNIFGRGGKGAGQASKRIEANDIGKVRE
jgi:RNA polymerase sigma-70 factor (ECF subfamily)